MRRRRVADIVVDHDRWLVSYSDFVTLLFAFFVVMYSISQVNEGKYKILSSELLEAFKVTPSAIKPIQVGDPSLSVDTSVIDPDKKNSETDDQGEAVDLMALSDQFLAEFSDLVSDSTLKVFGNELWLEVELNSNVLFSSGQASPSNAAVSIFEDVAKILSQFNNPVQVEGFTDNVPIKNQRFNNNWELSSARAASVVNLLERFGIAPKRLSAVGYGEYRPIADNTTENGRSENRRVVLMIARESIKRPRLDAEPQTENNPVSASLESAGEIVDPKIEDEIKNEPANLESEFEAGIDSSEPADVTEALIAPIKLDNGGLLFTSDPDLPRRNLNEAGGVSAATTTASDSNSE